MSNSRHGATYWIGIWWPVALGVGIIAFESTGFMGADHTSGPLRAVWQFLFGQVSEERWTVLHHYIRKSGHFFGYGYIGLAWLRAWWHSLPRSRFLTDFAMAILGTALIASADEFHQLFLPNRTGSAWDVLLDCTGAFVLQSLVGLFLLIFSPNRFKRAK
jgi:VanZ family protein